ncbi:MAG: peptidoglycan-associated lipoprotein Pal [Alphaproteobacteria bacterium]
MSRFSTCASLAAVSALLLLGACSTDKPPPGPAVSSETTIVPGSKRDFEVNVGDRVFFDYDRSDIRPDAAATLQKQAAWLARYPSVTLTIEGHCDERGTREYNLALGARRASTTKEYLISLGVSPSRLETISYGKERPTCVESNEGCWQQNRRGVSVISGGVSA